MSLFRAVNIMSYFVGNVAALYRADNDHGSGSSGSGLPRHTRSHPNLQHLAATSPPAPPQDDRMRDDDGNIDYEFD